MKNLWSIAFGVVCGLMGAGIIFLVSRPPRGQAVPLLPPPSPAPVVVYVSGAVQQPGVYPLDPGSRVQDAIQTAGGLLPEADTQLLNLAAPLEDGSHIQVPARPPTATPKLTPGLQATSKSGASTPLPVEILPTVPGLININTATLEELDTLPGIGPSIAQRIIDYRTTNGLFATIEDIQNVKGIGPVTFEKIKDLITVGP